MQAIFLDYHNTLTTDLFWRSLPIGERKQVNSLLFEKNISLVNDWMRGRVGSEDICRFLSQKLGISQNTLFECLVHDCRTVTIDSSLIAVLNQLRLRSRLILITGNMDCFKRFTVPSLKFYDLFDEVMSSHNFGLLKTDKDGMIFELAEARYSLILSECALIDDDVLTGQSFTRLGGQYFRVRSPAETTIVLKHLAQSSW